MTHLTRKKVFCVCVCVSILSTKIFTGAMTELHFAIKTLPSYSKPLFLTCQSWAVIKLANDRQVLLDDVISRINDIIFKVSDWADAALVGQIKHRRLRRKLVSVVLAPAIRSNGLEADAASGRHLPSPNIWCAFMATAGKIIQGLTWSDCTHSAWDANEVTQGQAANLQTTFELARR